MLGAFPHSPCHPIFWPRFVLTVRFPPSVRPMRPMHDALASWPPFQQIYGLFLSPSFLGVGAFKSLLNVCRQRLPLLRLTIQKWAKKRTLGCEKFQPGPAWLLLSKTSPPFSPSLCVLQNFGRTCFYLALWYIYEGAYRVINHLESNFSLT